MESVTALRNLHAAPKGASTPQEEAARGRGAAEQPPQRHGTARPAESNGNNFAAEAQPAARPQEGAGRRRQGERRRRHAWPYGTDLELIEENKRRLKALSQRYPGQLELRAPLGATPLKLRMRADRRAVRKISQHTSFTLTGPGSRGQPSAPNMGPDQSMGPGGLAYRISHPRNGRAPAGRLRAAPPNKPTAASGPGGRWGTIVNRFGVPPQFDLPPPARARYPPRVERSGWASGARATSPWTLTPEPGAASRRC